MTGEFSTFGILNRKSMQEKESRNCARYRTKDIPVDAIYSNSMNFYEQEGIEELADMILLAGLLHGPAVVYEPCESGTYRLISGERRWRALKLLKERGFVEFERVTCQLRDVENIHDEMIALILGNASREKDIGTLISEEQRLKSELEYMKSHNMKLNGYDLNGGRLRDVIADILNISKTKVAEIEAVSNRLCGSFMDRLKANQIPFSVAYQISKLQKSEQEELWQQYEERGEIFLSDVADFVRIKKEEQEKSQIPGQYCFGEVNTKSVTDGIDLPLSGIKEEASAEDARSDKISVFVPENVLQEKKVLPATKEKKTLKMSGCEGWEPGSFSPEIHDELMVILDKKINYYEEMLLDFTERQLTTSLGYRDYLLIYKALKFYKEHQKEW